MWVASFKCMLSGTSGRKGKVRIQPYNIFGLNKDEFLNPY